MDRHDDGRWLDDARPARLEPVAQPRTGAIAMTLTPGLTLLGLLFVLLAIPLALSVAPLVIGLILLIFAARRANDAVAEPA
jgi:hypothetical protein